MDLFAKYLEDTGLISKIKAHLRETVLDYMIFKIGLPSKIDKESALQDFLAKSYIKLVEDMRLTVTNRHSGKINSERSIICNYPSEVDANALHIFACEAAEENDKDKAKSLLLKMIDMDYESPAPFIKMAILMLQENNIDEAETYTKEVISIDTRHPIGLLLYAVILFLKEDFNTSELFLHAVTTFHPNFVEAWIAFYFFYWHFQMFEEARIIMSHVDKLMFSLPSKTENQPVIEEIEESKNNSTGIIDVIVIDDKNLNSAKVEEQTIDEKIDSNPQLNSDNLGLSSENTESKTLDAMSENPVIKRLDVMSYVDNDVLEPILSWFPEICDDDYATFLKTAIFLLTLRCFMFAEMSLNKVRQLSTNDEIAVIVEYLLACCDYLQHRPENALQHFNAALRFNIQPTPLHLLSGHCYYKMENFEKMEESYSFVQSVSKRPIAFQLHLMYLRLGNAKFMQEKFRDSSEFYFKSCEQICSPLAWLGLAKSCYMLESYLDAERCLCEANLLDCENGEIWGYLALVNHKLNRPAVFLDCYNQTKRFPSNNEMLRNEIGQLYYSFYESNCFINRRSTMDCVDIPD
ncbi:cilia- and flagella-associated protein 70 [Nilaparvata lugens]|uniref:cilia- and flagella-associated protein 70 n=1 Tax=Nilaparvata lugens TaxID=108931 RepID=UPI00193D9D5A|nr:cilia- and flagella-associated protein 70 [Nilaparvata lugens]